MSKTRGGATVQYIGVQGEVNPRESSDYAFLYDVSTVLPEDFVIGDRVITPDGRVFRLGKAGTGGVASEIGAFNSHGGGTNNTNTISSHVAPVQTGDATGLVRSTAITVTIAATDGEAGDGVVAVDELRGGYAIIGNGTSQHPSMRAIVGNSAVVSGGGTCTVYLDAPLIAVITASSTNIEILANPYSALVAGTSLGTAYVTFLGIPAATATVGQYFWLQTWGPCWVTSNSTTNQNANDRNLYFVNNGSLVDGTSALTQSHGDSTPMLQRAGVCMEKTASAHSGPPLCMLEISI